MLGLSVESKESVDGKLLYLATETSFDEAGLDLLKSAPQGYLYRLSAKYDTKLIITPQYKMVFSSDTKNVSYRNMGTYRDYELNPNILEKDKNLAKEANDLYNDTETAALIGLSAIIVDPKHRKRKADK